ncbi:MAG TPA: 7,8-didemethyl-8-hydroxy-5-deazariboflavin synthase subunit CofG [Methanothermobacter sp.]|nr:FO synthase subunit 1 [Methanothermobacter sp. MT-2]HHW04627.1 7,8-didemethyl-8-hydroxy-5-deazariboflavin synthase subunit CofG [Methanothermobacter sp.]HOK72092.1 7,8-didemethyl-8-hydroxy-5-deazariboflavin synthase subunit CofG [Methanothermobacter sp.]HOL68405.1 7,8-didemethyl-8-hydroxy-5-deazariboflavin synthase subunit CofG [Methanothermobacter sp.]HPQ04163.1 7,8-didemethyl-8-hydroxy-5-deazariboflavin synthase subunit CofG [Methanothermobacter sp.]
MRPSKDDLKYHLECEGIQILDLMKKALNLQREKTITYSRNVFIPVTRLCRNRCGYCTFRRDKTEPPILPPEDIMEQLKSAESYGCREALFTFGEAADQLEPVKDQLEKLGYNNMVEYLFYLCQETLDNTLLLPHTNMGILKYKELKMLREVNASMGLMLETSSPRLMETIAHKNSPGKDPKLRIKTIEYAGRLKIPFTTGLLIGIGETIDERVESLLELRRIQDKYGHIQEIIIQNFKSKPGIPMEDYPEPTLLEMIKMVAVSKMLFPDVSIQVPPNLNRETCEIFLLAGADDWGGISPLTRDYVNPEAPWPEIKELERITGKAGFKLKERLPVYPNFISEEYLSEKVLEKVNVHLDTL